MKVQIKHIYISPDHNYFGRYGLGSLDHPIVERESVELVAGKGVVDDRFFDYEPNYKGQISFFDEAVYKQLVSELSGEDFPQSAFRRNVIISGVDVNMLIGKRFTLDDIEFTGSCECSPCFWMDEAVAPGTHAFLKGRGGLRARILKDGVLTPGEYELKMTGTVEPDVKKES